MNLADYISELLGQQDNVTIPGLGSFVRIYVNASYNNSEARFYPPYHKVSFEPKDIEDDSFAVYVAKKKNISLESSKYFIEKFINKLKIDAVNGKQLFSDLGSFVTEANQLVFKPNERVPADPDFYGYLPVDIPRLGQPLSVDTKKPVFAQTQVAANPPVPPNTIPSAKTFEQHDYFEDDAEHKKRISVWLIVLLSLIAVGLAVFGVLKFYPETLDKISGAYHNLINKKTDTVTSQKQPNKNIVKKPVAMLDTIKRIVTPPVLKDTVKPRRFEAVAYECQHLWTANAKVGELKKQGYNAYVVMDAPGPLIKVSVGTFPTYASADSAVMEMIKTKKIRKHYLPIEIRTN